MHWIINPSIEEHKDEIKDFLQKVSGDSFFQTPDYVYLHQLNKDNILTLIGKKDGEITCYCNILILREKTLYSYLTRRALIIGGPLAINDEDYHQILLKINNILKKKVIYLQFRHLNLVSDNRKTILKQNHINYKSHFTIINTIHSEMLNDFNSGRRKNIRRAIKRGVEFRLLDSQKEYELGGEIITNMYNKLKIPCPSISFFKKMQLDSFHKKIHAFGAFYNENLISVRFCLNHKETLYDWYAASLPNHNKFYPNDYIVFKVMEWAENQNFSHFDFGGAGNMQEDYGVREFKLKFGGELMEHGRNEIVYQKVLYFFGKLGFKILKKLRK